MAHEQLLPGTRVDASSQGPVCPGPTSSTVNSQVTACCGPFCTTDDAVCTLSQYIPVNGSQMTAEPCGLHFTQLGDCLLLALEGFLQLCLAGWTRAEASAALRMQLKTCS